MHLDLSDEETLALLNLLTQTIDNEPLSAIAAHPDLAWRSRQVRPDGLGGNLVRRAQ